MQTHQTSHKSHVLDSLRIEKAAASNTHLDTSQGPWPLAQTSSYQVRTACSSSSARHRCITAPAPRPDWAQRTPEPRAAWETHCIQQEKQAHQQTTESAAATATQCATLIITLPPAALQSARGLQVQVDLRASPSALLSPTPGAGGVVLVNFRFQCVSGKQPLSNGLHS